MTQYHCKASAPAKRGLADTVRILSIGLALISIPVETAIAASSLNSPPPLSKAEEQAVANAAVKAYENQPVYLSGVDGKRVVVSDRSQSNAFKIDMFKRSLGKKAEAARPALRTAAEDQIRRRKPALAVVSWDAPSGTFEADFVIEFPQECRLKQTRHQMVAASKLVTYPCLKDRAFMQRIGGVKEVAVDLDPLPEDDRRWAQLVDKEITATAVRQFAKGSH